MTNPKVILFDDNCPLCCWYTSAFVRIGLLPEDGRRAFAEVDPTKLVQDIDLERSRDEIPLLDSAGGETLYGIDSLLYILGQRWPWMANIARWAPIDWLIRRLYKFISYNRRVIVAGETAEGSFDCSPQFNYFYRYLYVFFAALIGSMGTIVFMVAHGFKSDILITIMASTIILTSPMLGLPNHASRLNYLGIMLTPLLVVGLLLTAFSLATAPVWTGVLALALAARMWFKRWRVAIKS